MKLKYILAFVDWNLMFPDLILKADVWNLRLSIYFPKPQPHIPLRLLATSIWMSLHLGKPNLATKGTPRLFSPSQLPFPECPSVCLI